jgi:hypothetical protein
MEFRRLRSWEAKKLRKEKEKRRKEDEKKRSRKFSKHFFFFFCQRFLFPATKARRHEGKEEK